MKVRKLVIFTMLVSALFSLYGCSNFNTNETASKENNVVKSDQSKSEIDSSTESKTSEENTLPKSNTNETNSLNKGKANEQNNAPKNGTSQANKTVKENSLIYASKLGFSITFPYNWKNRYTIKEDDNSMSVYFKSTDINTPKNSGLFFVIMKNVPNDENLYDSINGKKHINIGNKTYFIGGPTDVGLDPENKDFSIFSSMKKELGKVIGTIKSLK